MDFWNEFSEKLNDTANRAAKGIDTLGNLAKTRYRLAVKRRELEQQYEKLGRLHYDEFRIPHFDGTSEALEICRSIDALRKEIAALESALGTSPASDSARFCPKCGFELEEDMAFCPKCGEKIEK